MAINNKQTKKAVTKVTEKAPEVVETSEPEIKVVEKKKYAPDDEIMTTSCTAGQLIMIGSKTGRFYTWADYNDQTPVEYQDLKAEQYRNSPYIFKPLFLIEDDEFIHLPENKKIADVYQNILTADDIEKLFSLDSISFERTVKKAPKGIQDSIRTIATQKVQDGSLDSVSKIKAIDEILGTDLFNCYIAS